VIVELAPVPVAPSSPVDLAPGPQMQEEQTLPQPQPEPTTELQIMEPLPPLPAPAVVAQSLPPPKAPPETKPEVKPVEPPPPEVKRVEEHKAAPLTTASPRSERNTAARPAAPSPGAVASRAALASWQSEVVSKLQRVKRYPRGAEERREQGVVTVAFTVSRSGGVLSRHIMRGSGHAELDQEALAMVQRAAPFPPFPPGMTQASAQLSAPIRFSLH
jgi:protein TonB